MARRPEPRSLIAAARRLQTTAVAKRPALTFDERQSEAWEYYDAVPEVKHAVRYVGNSMAKLRVFPAVPHPDDPEASPVPLTDDAAGCPPAVAEAAAAELARLRSDRGGQSEILKQLAMNLDVAGEGFIVGRAEQQTIIQAATGDVVEVIPESWEVHSISEVTLKNGQYTIEGTDRPLGPDDTIIRVWVRHPRWADRPDSNLMGLLTECEALLTLSLQTIGDTNSKRNNGFLLVPNELTFGPANQTADGDDDDPDDDPVFQALAETMQGPIGDPTHPASAQPTLVRGPAEVLGSFRHVLASRPADSSEAKIEGLVGRLARGIDLPVEVVMGHQGTTFSNAGQVDQDTFDDYMAPRADALMDALTFGYLTPQLAENPAVPPEWAARIVVAYDPSALISKPDPAGHAGEAHARLVISDEALRRTFGFAPEDAPDEDELLRRTGLSRGILTGDLTLALLKLLGVPIEVAVPSEVPIDSTGTPQPVAASARELEAPPPRPDALTAARPVRARNNYGARLLGIDVDLRARLTVAADAALNRALERAGNRLRSKSAKLGVDRAVLRHVDARNVAATLGPAISAAADPDVLDAAWDELETQFRAWAAASQDAALTVAERVASGFSAGQRDVLKLRQAADVDEAWLWMRGSLDSLAQARMFDPSPVGVGLGEFDPLMNVPTGLVRQALARAGGATGLTTSGTDMFVALYPDGTPPGMIGTGELVSGVLADAGAEVEGFRWVYGPGTRRNPFQPHMDLDGTPFVNFDDDVLSNSSGWPEDAFYFPGDHSGCLCDYEPIILTPDEAAALP